MKKIIGLLLGSTLSFSCLKSHELLPLPDEFFVQEHWVSWTKSFDILTSDYPMGSVSRKFLSLMTTYEFFNEEKELKAIATMQFFNLGVVFHVTNEEAKPLGQVEENIFTFFPKFDILAPNKTLLAKATLNFWGTQYKIEDPETKKEIASITRPFFRLKDDWTVKIINRELFEEKQIPYPLFVLVAVFQTDIDYWSSLAKSLKRTISMDGVFSSLDEENNSYSPTDEEIEAMERFSNEYLTDLFDGEQIDRNNRLQRGVEALLSLSQSEILTEKEKATLLHLLKNFFSN